MEVQVTDFENAAFAVFIVLLSRAIMSMNINFYIPISKVGRVCRLVSRRDETDTLGVSGTQVDENMRRAQQRDAVNQSKFYFRRGVFTPAPSRATSGAATPDISRPSSVAPSSNKVTNGFDNGNNHSGRPKQRMMENCFPPPPLPDEGLVSGSVMEEYAEYTMDEIINGRAMSDPHRVRNNHTAWLAGHHR
jgi:glutamate--cysteine ligase catalytic subunit